MPDTHAVDKLIDLKRHIAKTASARFVQMVEAPL